MNQREKWWKLLWKIKYGKNCPKYYNSSKVFKFSEKLKNCNQNWLKITWQKMKIRTKLNKILQKTLKKMLALNQRGKILKISYFKIIENAKTS